MQQPLHSKHMIRLLVILIVFLSLLAGYFHSRATLAERKLQKLQQKIDVQMQVKE